MATRLRTDPVAAVTELIDRARSEGSKVVSIEAVEAVVRPKHELDVRGGGDWYLRHPRCAVAECPVSVAVRTAPILSSPHAVGHTYQVWIEDGETALSFLDVTGREGT